MWTAIVGKVRLALEPRLNHWWQLPLYVSARGLTTSLMHAGERGIEIEFDDRSQRLSGWRVAQSLRHRVPPCGAFRLHSDQLGGRVVPPLRAGATVRGAAVTDDGPGFNALVAGARRLKWGVAAGGGARAGPGGGRVRPSWGVGGASGTEGWSGC